MMPRIAIPTILALLVMAVPAVSQERRQRIEKEVLETQRRMREGKVVRANVRVTARLKNGSRLRGVVKGGRFVERLDEREFVETDVKGPNAGLRLWYYDDTNSYIFLPYETLAHYKIGEKLTDEEVAAIAQRIDDNRKMVVELRKRQLANRERAREQVDQQKKAEEKAAEEAAKVAKEKAETELTPAQKRLLADFPPDAGWGLDKLKELERRKITVSVYPNEREQRFIDSFTDWNEAYEKSQAIEEAEKKAEAPAVEPPGPPNAK